MKPVLTRFMTSGIEVDLAAIRHRPKAAAAMQAETRLALMLQEAPPAQREPGQDDPRDFAFSMLTLEPEERE